MEFSEQGAGYCWFAQRETGEVEIVLEDCQP